MRPVNRCTRVEIVTIRAIPSVRARATTSSSSLAKSGKSRWQWLSTNMAVRMVIVSWSLCRRRLCFDVAWENRRWRWKLLACGDAMAAAEERKRPLAGWHGQEIEELFRRSGHERLCQEGDLPKDLGGHIEHRALLRRIGLGQGPW